MNHAASSLADLKLVLKKGEDQPVDPRDCLITSSLARD